MKKLVSLLIVSVVILFFGLFIGQKYIGSWNGKDDYRLGIIANEGVMMVSISPSRRMVNVLRIDKEAEVWIPRGRGWYRSDRIRRIVQEMKEPKIDKEIFFYNFGFWPEKVVYQEKVDSWQKTLRLVDWWKYKLLSSKMVENETNWGPKWREESQGKDILERDFSDSRLVNSEVRVSVVNGTDINGLGQFLADRLGWLGMAVVSVENSSLQVKNCRIEVSNDLSQDKGFEFLWFNESALCSMGINNDLREKEVVIYLGTDWVEMIKYDNVRTL